MPKKSKNTKKTNKRKVKSVIPRKKKTKKNLYKKTSLSEEKILLKFNISDKDINNENGGEKNGKVEEKNISLKLAENEKKNYWKNIKIIILNQVRKKK